MERLLPACCDMCPSVALCQLLLNLWSATAISAQATSAKQNRKKKKIHFGPIQFVSFMLHMADSSKSRFNSILLSNLFKCDTNSSKLLQLWCNLFKGPVWHILYSGSSSKMTKSIQVTHFLFFSNLNSEEILYDFTARFFPV